MEPASSVNLFTSDEVTHDPVQSAKLVAANIASLAAARIESGDLSADLVSQLQEIARQLSEAESQNRLTEAELAARAKAIEREAETLARLRQDFEQSRNEWQASHEEFLKTQRQWTQQVQKQDSALQQKLDKLEACGLQLKSLPEISGDTSTSAPIAESRISHQRDIQLEMLLREAEERESDLIAENRKLEERIDQLAKELDESLGRGFVRLVRDDYTAMADELEAAHRDADRLRRQISQQDVKMEAIYKELEALQQGGPATDKVEAESPPAFDEEAFRQELLQQSEAEKEELRQNLLQQAEAEKEKLSQELLQQSATEKAELQQKLEQISTDRDTLKKQLEQALVERSVLQGQIDQATAEQGTLQQASQEQGEQNQKALEAARELIEELETECAAMASRLEETAAEPSETPTEATGELEEKIDLLQRRYEMAMEDVKSLEAENQQLQQALQIAKAPVSAGGPTQNDVAQAIGELDWEEEKRRLMAVLESDFQGDDQETKAERLKIENVIEQTDRLVQLKTHEVEELRALLENQSTQVGNLAVGVGAFAEAFEHDELIAEERENLKRLQTELHEKLKKAEVEISIERAKVARERVEIDEMLDRLGYTQETMKEAAEEAEKERSVQGQIQRKIDPKVNKQARWFDKMGIKDEDNG